MLKNPISSLVANGNIDGVCSYLKSDSNIKFIIQRDGLLHTACKYGHLNIAKELCKFGADCGYKNPTNQRIPLHDACAFGNVDLVEFIVVKSLDLIDSIDNNGWTPSHICVMEGELECLEILRKYEADLTVKDKNGMQIIHWAAKRNHEKIIKYLYDLKININVQCDSGKTALHYAAINNSLNAIQMLLKCSADISLDDNEGSSPLHMAAKHNSVESLRFLVSTGIPIDIRQNRGRTPSHIASYQGFYECLHWLLDKGADILAVEDEGNTIGHYACRGGHGETIHCYLNHNGSVDEINKLGENLYQTARRYGHPVIFEKAKKAEVVCSICQLENNKRKWDQLHAPPSVVKIINQSQKSLFRNPLGSHASVVNDFKKMFDERKTEIDRKRIETINIGKISSQKVKKASTPHRIEEGGYRELINRYYGDFLDNH